MLQRLRCDLVKKLFYTQRWTNWGTSVQKQYPPAETSDRFLAALQEAKRSLPNIPVEILNELFLTWGNKGWSAKEELLAGMTQQAWETEGTILECGSGLSTLILGLVAKHKGQRVVCLEHSEHWAIVVQNALDQFGLTNVELLFSPLVSYDDYDWYKLPANTFQEQEITLVVCDGPPEGTRGCRHGVLPVTLPFLHHGAVILLDDVQAGGASVLARWKREFGLDSVVEGSIKTYGRTVIP